MVRLENLVSETMLNIMLILYIGHSSSPFFSFFFLTNCIKMFQFSVAGKTTIVGLHIVNGN